MQGWGVRSFSVTLRLAIATSCIVSAETAEYPSCSARTAKDYSLLDPVKSVRMEQIEPDGQRAFTSQYLFDRTGRLLENREAIAGDDSERPRLQVFRTHYDLRGKNYQVDMFEVDPAQGQQPIDLQRHLVKFDTRGRCIEQRDLDSDGELNGKSTYEYDGRGDLVRTVVRLPGSTILSIENRTYRSDHKLLAEQSVENRGQGLSYHSSREHRYDERGNETEVVSYQQGVMEARWLYGYDERNRLISSETVVADPKKDQRLYGRCSDCGLSSGKTTYSYNQAGQLIEERLFQPSGELVSVNRHFYDERGKPLEAPDRSFRNDSHGNWVESTVRSKGPSGNQYRTIEYY